MISNKRIKRMFEPSIANGKTPIARRIDACLYVGPSRHQPIGFQHPGAETGPGYNDAWVWENSAILISKNGKVSFSHNDEETAYLVHDTGTLIWF